MGLGRVELPTSRLSGVRSHQLSYRPRDITAHKDEVRVYSNNSLAGCQGEKHLENITLHHDVFATIARGNERDLAVHCLGNTVYIAFGGIRESVVLGQTNSALLPARHLFIHRFNLLQHRSVTRHLT